MGLSIRRMDWLGQGFKDTDALSAVDVPWQEDVIFELITGCVRGQCSAGQFLRRTGWFGVRAWPT